MFTSIIWFWLVLRTMEFDVGQGFWRFVPLTFVVHKFPPKSTTSATTSSRKENMRHDVDTDIFFIPTILLFFVSVTTRSSWAYGVSGISPRENSWWLLLWSYGDESDMAATTRVPGRSSCSSQLKKCLVKNITSLVVLCAFLS